MNLKSIAVRVWLVTILAAGAAWAGALPSLNSADLAQGAYSSMHMLLEKTFLKVDVLTVDVRFGKADQARFRQLASGKKYSPELGRELAKVAIASDHAVVQLHFVRDVSLDQWMDAVRDNLAQAKAAGLISAALQKRVGGGLPKTFALLQERGYEEGDRLLYGIRGATLDTAVISAKGKVLMQKHDDDRELSRVVLASYFAPGSDFRELLLRSMVK